MPTLGKLHPATLATLAGWSTLSRNEVGPMLTRFGIAPLRRKYPMLRVYQGLLGLTPSDSAEEKLLGMGLIRTSRAAPRFGLSPDALLGELRTPGNTYPPLYVFGPKRHLLLRGQFEELLGNPRNAWPVLEPSEGHALPASRLARALEVDQARIDAVLADERDLPAHVIAQGHIRYIVADIRHRLDARPEAPQAAAGAASGTDNGRSPSRTEPPEGGLFAGVTQKVTGG